MIRLFENIQAWREFRGDPDWNGTLGFVPTMGALHAGHISLVERSRRENERTLVSIFVNPTQFDNPEDLRNYPSTLARDLELLREAGVDYVIQPDYAGLYPDHYRYVVTEKEQSRVLCGAHRPGHFDGVLTVVLKLLNLARAERAYFGEKDYQQLELVRGMAEAFFLPTEIVACPTVREADGLALSSRNARLTPAQRELAPRFPSILRSPMDCAQVRIELEKQGFQVDYVEEHGRRRFGAARLGNVRLIDNVAL